ncbi:MAG TPA: hypothetical protein VLX92_10015 [Kofleriaceae bacterium]|nr:hypothetical protein [Kofleriaceae bacterium]
MRSLLLASLLLARAATADAGFAVRSSQPLLGTITPDLAEHLAESQLWQQAFARCAPSLDRADPARDPVRLGAPSFSHGKDYVSATARFECGVGDTPDLGKRLADAQLVIVGHVIAVSPVRSTEPISEHSAHWMIASVAVDEALKGSATHVVEIYFPASDDVMWSSRPKLRDGQAGVFVIHDGVPGPQMPDRLDVAPPERRDLVWRLLQP